MEKLKIPKCCKNDMEIRKDVGSSLFFQCLECGEINDETNKF